MLEQLADSMQLLRRAAARTDLIVATTEVVGVPAPPLGEWRHWAPEHGRHVAFYSRESLLRIGDAIGMRYVPPGRVQAWTRDASLAQRLAMLRSPVRRAFWRSAGGSRCRAPITPRP